VKYIKITISLIFILLGSTLISITVDDELMYNIFIKLVGLLSFIAGVVSGRREIKKGKLKNVNN
jgi:hypothetical protein